MEQETVKIKLKLSFFRLLKLVLPIALVAGGIGAYPTWIKSGTEGLIAELTSAIIAIIVVTSSGMLLVWCGKHSPLMIAKVFTPSVVARVFLSLALGGAMWQLFALPPIPLLVWLLVFYIITLVVESYWLMTELKKYLPAASGDGDGKQAEVKQDRQDDAK